jgi:hypothetical protein
MVSKQRFSGNQEHDYFMSLRPVYPWDAGDTTFDYDPEVDKADRFRRLRANNGWYTRRDLNFSFCTDGRDPLSGYTVMYGGNDNAGSWLLRRGRVVAENRDARFVRREDLLAVHWEWWNFNVRFYGKRIVVTLNGEKLFDYTDPRPLSGGHVGLPRLSATRKCSTSLMT